MEIKGDSGDVTLVHTLVGSVIIYLVRTKAKS